LAKWEEI